jgi:hypothetical protein
MSVKLPIDVDRLVVWAKTDGIALSKQKSSTIKPEKSPDTFGLWHPESLNPTAGCISPVAVLLREFTTQEVPDALHELVGVSHVAERPSSPTRAASGAGIANNRHPARVRCSALVRHHLPEILSAALCLT